MDWESDGAGALWQMRAQAELDRRQRAAARRQEAEQRGEVMAGDWEFWLTSHFPRAVAAGFAPHHRHLWEWIEALTPDVRPRPRVEPWARGGAKSSTAELGAVRVGTKLSRRFLLYVSGRQDLANLHVGAIAAKFEALGIERAVGKYGASKGWRVDLLRTANGFNVLALGLDAAARGVKLDDFRPDAIWLDDIDDRHDTAATVQRKIATVTESILPSGSGDCAILFVQNLIHAESIMAALCGGTADFLLECERPVVVPAVEGLVFESETQPDGTRRYRITGGTATWAGQDIKTCERQLNDWGRAAFLREAQHQVEENENGLWNRADIDRNRIAANALPVLQQIAVGVDPPGSSGRCGIVASGRAGRGPTAHYYTLEDATPPPGTPPGEWAAEVVATCARWQTEWVAVEVNYGGDMVIHTLRQTPGGERLKIVRVTATRGKLIRAEPVAALSEAGREHHVGGWPELERQKCSYQPGETSPDNLDADVWSKTLLMQGANVTPPPRSENWQVIG